MPKPPAAPSTSPSQAEQIDRALTSEALKKRQLGQQPNARELAALKRFEKRTEEQRRREYMATIPQKHWREMSGRQAKVINEQAALYGIPIAGATINLADVAKWIHDTLAEHGRKILASTEPGGDPDLELKRIKTTRQHFAHERDLGQWISREDVHAGLAIFAEGIRRAGEKLQRMPGAAAAAQALEEAFADVQRDLELYFAPPTDETTPPPPAA